MANNTRWKQRYQLGAELAKELDTYSTLDEIAAELGTTRQNVYMIAVQALGKLANGLIERLGNDGGSV